MAGTDPDERGGSMTGSPLVVVGFHRSGTSLLSHLLHRAGLFLGEQLLGAMPSNPYGHFEDVEIVRLHETILRDHGDTWHITKPTAFHIRPEHWATMQAHVQERSAAHRLWGFKDPRVCFFLGAWKYLMPGARFVVVYRDPSECVFSLERRQAADLFASRGNAALHRRFWREADHGMKMWIAYNRAILNFVNEHRDDCLVVPFTHLSRGFPVVAEINRQFGTDLLEIPTTAVFDPSATTARPGPQWVFSPNVAERASRIWEQFEQVAVPHRPEVRW